MAVPRRSDGRQGEMDRAGRGRNRRVGHDLPRRRGAAARLDAVRAGGPLSARGRVARRPAVARRGARHLRVPRRPLEPVGDAVALPRGDRRGARPGRDGGRGVRVPLSGGRDAVRALPGPTRRCSRATSSRTSASAPCASRAASSSRVWTSAALHRSRGVAAPASCAPCARRSRRIRCRRRGHNGQLVLRPLAGQSPAVLRRADLDRIESDLNAALVWLMRLDAKLDAIRHLLLEDDDEGEEPPGS